MNAWTLCRRRMGQRELPCWCIVCRDLPRIQGILVYDHQCINYNFCHFLQNPWMHIIRTSHAGVSRSAAIVTAFIMKTDNLSFEEAYSKLKTVKPDVRINDEFVKQLKLYEIMGCTVDLTSADYKQYRLQKVSEKFPELQNLPKELFAVDPMSLGKTSEAIYRCRKCRRCLFRGSSNLSHVPGTGPIAFAHKRLTQSLRGDQTKCTSYFIEPVQWMKSSLLGVLDGQLLCPKCNSKLGSFNWYGDQCSCGRWVTPAFQIHKSRVDEMKHLNIISVGNVNS
ncbi:dual specificity protein phosphatase 12 isoform X2 [Narcine bancroftii]|uniref:dual specificity protein phosphatase 12 isoform X2 n=1 Tax=Narcine bancroftii TaxID=1343680 RepID=UPI0038312BDF